jgi:hypothetical protein
MKALGRERDGIWRRHANDRETFREGVLDKKVLLAKRVTLAQKSRSA